MPVKGIPPISVGYIIFKHLIVVASLWRDSGAKLGYRQQTLMINLTYNPQPPGPSMQRTP